MYDYKTSICTTYKIVKEYNSGPGENVLLADRYTELLIVERNREQREREEEIRFRGKHHQQVLKTRASEAYSRISVDQLFKPDDGGDVPKAVILQGNSGHGKSITAQKIMYDWASGKVFKDLFHLVLHLKCKELNEISEACSLVDLLSYCPSFTSETAEVLKDSKMKVLFLIDGFDELKFSFEKTSTVPPKDPFTRAPVEVTLGALLKGLLYPKCCLLVTTRSTASDKLSKLLSDSQRFADILGFTEEGVKEYFQRFFKEELLAKKIFDCVKTNETLYTACFIPVICWITCTVFMEQEEEGMDITKELETTTSIFEHFVSTLLKHHCQGLSQPETLLRSLGQLAERGLQEHQVLFDEKSLSEAFPDPSQATKYNPFLCKFFLRRKVKQERMYSFMHLSFQEFFAALQYLMLENEEEALDKLRELFGNVERFKPVVQFLFGLSNRDIYPDLNKQSRPSIKAYLKKWLLSVLENHRMHQEGMLHILHCLYERHEEEFVREAMGVWGEVKFDRIPLTRTDCWVLLYCLQCCPIIRGLWLKKCNITAEKLRMLQPALSRCEELGLTVENLSDDDVFDLISALGEGKILTKLSVVGSNLSPESVKEVLSALSRQKSVGGVHLSVTTITVPTAALCLDFIQNTETCRELMLKDNSRPLSVLSVDKDSAGLRLDVNSLLSSTRSPASLTLLQVNNQNSGSFTDFIHKFRGVTGLRANSHKTPGDRMGVLESFTDWWTLPGLEKVELEVSCLTESWAYWILNLIHTCPTLKEVELRCTKPSGKCGEENNPLLPCNQRVKIQMRGPNVTEEIQDY
ncbi:NACHT, LRR and PYD domains-containing protein 1 homolog [Clupea harengus]|uniref:NACHT, LRR and PYD domains-containing protein 1 homolog n=1 Tax=Clupea harengus TaxID=7950 RepID=A0A8M1KB48_CLUHA|nr:NACHT, LRR and PYD domains-containing protein 1 homolog [Clupea harengus]